MGHPVQVHKRKYFQISLRRKEEEDNQNLIARAKYENQTSIGLIQVRENMNYFWSKRRSQNTWEKNVIVKKNFIYGGSNVREKELVDTEIIKRNEWEESEVTQGRRIPKKIVNSKLSNVEIKVYVFVIKAFKYTVSI